MEIVAIGGILVGGGICASDYWNKVVSSKKFPDYLPKLQTIPPDPELKDELYSRVISYFGEEKFQELEQSFVIVVGVGGVGSHAANMLIRSGIRKIRIIDFDQVTLSSLNRHAFANTTDVGIPKVEAVARHMKKIIPWIEVEAYAEMFRGDQADRLLAGSPAYVLDCIDDVNTKGELLAYCVTHGIRVLTSMGAGGKSDPTKIRIGTLSDCVNDPLASKIKWKLKKFNVSPDDIMTVFSAEKPVKELLPLSDEQHASPEKFGAVENMRLRVMPVLGTSPAIFGQTMASFVLTQLGGCPYDPETAERLSKNVRNRMRQVLGNNEKKRFLNNGDVDLDDDDMEFIVSQVWGTRCAVTGRRIGGQSLMALTRWNPQLPLSPYNLVLVQQTILPFIESLHDISQTTTDSPLTPEVIERISNRLNWARVVCENDWPPKGIRDADMPQTITNKANCHSCSCSCSWSQVMNSPYRGPLILLPSILAFIALTYRSKR